jgi:hypothetical protein
MRFEIFPDDLDVIVDFYTRVLLFRLTVDQRDDPDPDISLQRDDVCIGAARRAVPDDRAPGCRLPAWSWCLRLTTSMPSATALSRRNGRSRRTSRTGHGA